MNRRALRQAATNSFLDERHCLNRMSFARKPSLPCSYSSNYKVTMITVLCRCIRHRSCGQWKAKNRCISELNISNWLHRLLRHCWSISKQVRQPKWLTQCSPSSEIINAQMMSIEKVRGHFYWTLQRIRKSQNDKNASDQVKWYLPHYQRSIKQPNQTLHQQHLRLFFNLQRATATWRFAGVSATHLPRLYIIIYLQ